MYERFLAVTCRALCRDGLMMQLRRIAQTDVRALILREKDLSPDDYEALAKPVFKLFGDRLILHTHLAVARRLPCRKIHLPLPLLEKADLSGMETIGASCHSVEEAKRAERLGATYITAGHIFATDCKKGIPGRGPAFLAEICASVHIPVYAIGGVTPENLPGLLRCGAAGGCMMSGFMTLRPEDGETD